MYSTRNVEGGPAIHNGHSRDFDRLLLSVDTVLVARGGASKRSSNAVILPARTDSRRASRTS